MAIAPSTLQFLRDLKENNSREWFEANRKVYETAKKDFEKFLESYISEVAKFHDLGDLLVKEVTFRINRDVRFSKDKTPYKINFSGALAKGGKKSHLAPFYFHLQPGESFLATGAYMPTPAQLAALRQELDYNGQRFLDVVDNKAFKKLYPEVQGDKLKTTPKGYDASHPMIEYLKFKSLTVSTAFSDEDLVKEEFLGQLVHASEVMVPFMDYINDVMADVPVEAE
jgi:uncharacterized protein (TIGR02453 family)